MKVRFKRTMLGALPGYAVYLRGKLIGYVGKDSKRGWLICGAGLSGSSYRVLHAGLKSRARAGEFLARNSTQP